jgi:hypothetical protein
MQDAEAVKRPARVFGQQARQRAEMRAKVSQDETTVAGNGDDSPQFVAWRARMRAKGVGDVVWVAVAWMISEFRQRTSFYEATITEGNWEKGRGKLSFFGAVVSAFPGGEHPPGACQDAEVAWEIPEGRRVPVAKIMPKTAVVVATQRPRTATETGQPTRRAARARSW